MDRERIGMAAREAAAVLGILSTDERNAILRSGAEALVRRSGEILQENAVDYEKALAKGMSEGLLDRLKLTEERIAAMAKGLLDIAALADPIGQVSGMTTRPNGLMIGKRRVPMGVIAIIYEARPNVTSDAFGLCVKSGNAVILRGGSDALCSCRKITEILRDAAEEAGTSKDIVQYVDDTSHDSVRELIQMKKYVDLAIPRGGAGLIQRVVTEATVPVIETGVGNCHVYVDEAADLPMAVRIIVNAKTQRLGVCNACESLLVHEKVAEEAVPMIADALAPYHIEIRADEAARAIVPALMPATEEDWGTEYLDRIISLKIVPDLDTAIRHINRYGTRHSEAIITENYSHANTFLARVDAAAVYVNASTRFTDGGEFGLGAEIGISTQKMHARGPMGLEALTCEKYIILGNGQVRPD